MRNRERRRVVLEAEGALRLRRPHVDLLVAEALVEELEVLRRRAVAVVGLAKIAKLAVFFFLQNGGSGLATLAEIVKYKNILQIIGGLVLGCIQQIRIFLNFNRLLLQF